MSDENNISLKDLYEKIDATVNEFLREFTSLLPVSDQTHVSRMIIVNDVIALKEKAKMSINTYVIQQQKESNDAESNKED